MVCTRSFALTLAQPFERRLLCRFVVLVAFTWTNFPLCSSSEVTPERCHIWGPGLQPGVVLPVRYFYIQAVNSKGENLTFSPGKDTFKVKVSTLAQKQHIRIHVPPPLDRGDGSFLVRYRLYGSTLEGLKVEVLHRDAAVAKSPYTLQGPVYHEYCDCPEPDASTWESVLRCPAEEPQVLEDLSSFPSVDLERLRQEVPRRFANRGGLIHYAVIDNQVYRRSLGKYTDFKMFSDEMLLSLTRKYKYQVNVDGTVAAYRFPYLMLGNSLVLKQDSPYYEHFYSHLRPGTHYIPVKRSLSDILEKIKWAKENDAEAQEIAKAGQALVRELLQPARLYCYYYRVLQLYSERQSDRPTQHPDMELVPQPDDNTARCTCERESRKDEPTVEKDEL
ncbi:protein O-glucosyltransferase 3 isoform X3 [Centroberyx affinis]|uniref:protein O-glucosyltransferase 3 isoform X3 n=1 Tax=Centroberyx affinis TaxID=166261 RepID=UPI003A5B9E2B